MSKILYLDLTYDGGKTWNAVTKLDVDNLALLNNIQVKLRYEEQTTSTTTTTTTTSKQRVYTLTPPESGRVVINTAQPGDIIQLRGSFKSVEINNISGTATNPIRITNYPGETTNIGDPLWNGGSYANSVNIWNCHYLVIFGESKDKLIFEGSTQAQRTAYNTFYAQGLTDNLEVYNFTLRNGGTGFVCKTNPTSDAKTYNGATALSNFSFHDFEIYNTLHEGLYIGHTATYWNLTNNTPFYGTIGNVSTGWVSTSKYVEPLKLNNVKIYNGIVTGAGYDGIQTAACNNLEIYKNVVVNYGTGSHAGDMSAMCSGGKNTNVNIHDNIIHDGTGEFMYIFGSGANHIVQNNLMYNNKGTAEGIVIRGTNQLQVKIINNTIASVGNTLIRINSYFETGVKPPMIITNNILAQPLSGGGTIYDKYYIYLENGATATATGNVMIPTLKSTTLDAVMKLYPTVGYKA